MRSTNILLTNDDGIRSPGLWAAAQALSQLGYVTVAAPREQSSGAGRSLPNSTDGIIHEQVTLVNDQPWKVFAVGGTPAQAVLHAILEIMPACPDLVVAGINYGENVGSGLTISGTVGAALEAASHGIPALAISLETDIQHHLSYSEEIDFSSAAFFARYFASLLLNKEFPPDVDVLKVDVPCDATPETPWAATHMSRMRYFEPVAPSRREWTTPGRVGYQPAGNPADDDPLSDVYTLRVKRIVSVTPVSLDLTSRVNLADFERLLRNP